jgi:hypothetical protein
MAMFLLLNGGVMLAAASLAARLGLSGSAQAMGLGTLGGFLVLIHTSVLLAGLLGYLTASGVAIVALAAIAAVACGAYCAREPHPPAVVPDLPGIVPGEGEHTEPSSLFAPLTAIAALVAWAWPHVSEATRLWVWDDYTYHMVYPALWLREQAIAAMPAAQTFTMQAWYPLSASVVAAWFMVPFPHVREETLAWVSLTGLLYAGLVVAGTATLFRRLGCRRGAWAVSVVLFATSHRTAIMASSFSDADLAQAACLFAAVVFSVPRADTETARDVRVDGACAALLSGLALGVKVSAVAPALVVALTMSLRARACPEARRWPAGAIALIFLLSWSATAGYWYARNVIHTGNPVYPAALLGWSGATFPETTLLEYAERHGVRRTVADALPVYLNWPRLHGWLALLGLAGLAVWLAARRSSLTRPRRYFAGTALGVAVAVVTLLPAAPFSAGNAMTFRSGFIHWDSMRYVAVLALLGWAALGVLVNAGAGAKVARTVAAILIAAAAGVMTLEPRWLILPLAGAVFLGIYRSLGERPGARRARGTWRALRAPGVHGAVLPARRRGSENAWLPIRACALVGGMAVAAVAVLWSHEARVSAGRAAFYSEPLFGAAAAVLDGQPPGTRLAVFGDQWIYPSFGERLHLRPVRLDRDGDVATLPIAGAMEPGDRTVEPAVFRSRLAAAGIGLVVVVRQPHPGRSPDLPTQHAALEVASGAELLYRDRAVAIWRLAATGGVSADP